MRQALYRQKRWYPALAADRTVWELTVDWTAAAPDSQSRTFPNTSPCSSQDFECRTFYATQTQFGCGKQPVKQCTLRPRSSGITGEDEWLKSAVGRSVWQQRRKFNSQLCCLQFPGQVGSQPCGLQELLLLWGNKTKQNKKPPTNVPDLQMQVQPTLGSKLWTFEAFGAKKSEIGANFLQK